MTFIRLIKSLAVAVVFLASAFFCIGEVYSLDSGISVDMTVPSLSPGCSSNCTPVVDAYPAVSIISTTTSYTTAEIKWSASDDKGISSMSFYYSKDGSYSLAGTITGSYQVNLSGLATSTVYNFKIAVTDTASQTTERTGTFNTLAPTSFQDVTPPVVSGIGVSVGITTSTITWQTNEPAYDQLDYSSVGQTTTTVNETNLKTSHSINLSNLLPNTVYFYRIIATDFSTNSTSTQIFSFTTHKDNTSPPNVSGPYFATSSGMIIVSWVNPSFSLVPDFYSVKVLRKIGTYSTNANDGTLIYSGTNQSVNDISFSFNTTYYYTVFSFDTSFNTSTGVFASFNYVSSTPITVVEICDNGLDDDNDGLVDCQDTSCFSFSACKTTPSATTTTEICNNKKDDDGDLKIDCLDEDCFGSLSCHIPPAGKVENCSNGVDDDGDGLVDCKDGDCVGYSGCNKLPGSSTKPACNDGIDNDNDGLIDYPLDDGCDSATDTDEYKPPVSTVPSFARINLSDIGFYFGDGKIKITPIDSTITGLAGISLRISVPINKLASTPSSTMVRVSGNSYQLVLDQYGRDYTTDLLFPTIGTSQAYLEINYGANQFDSVSFKLSGLAWGDVFSDSDEGLSGTTVALYQRDGQLAQLEVYGQRNPYKTNTNANYGWAVPNGDYYLIAQKDGYYDLKTAVFKVSNNTVNTRLSLITRPKKISEIIDTNADLATNLGNVAKNLGQKSIATTKRVLQETKNIALDTAKTVQEAVDNPVVEQTAEQVVVPASAGIVGISVLPFLSWTDLLPFLRLLFLQPLMVLGWSKRKKWGVVYNSLNKLPVDLAMVRLIDLGSGKLIQSKVTDKDGRYFFIANPGKYKLEVKKVGFVYPSTLLMGYAEDGRRTDLYHGEDVLVGEEKVSIIANIPLDPIGDHKKPWRLVWSKIGRLLQRILTWVGIVITSISLYIVPSVFVATLLLLHVVLFLLFRVLTERRAIKSWGIVYDQGTNKPVNRAIARLFNTRFNKLVSTQVTDRKGRYQFLAGDDKYFVTYEHAEYHPHQTEVDLKGKEEDVVDVDVSLEKKT